MKTGLVGSFAFLCACGLMCSVASQAQVCQVNNATLSGAYGYVALQTVWTTNMNASMPMTGGPITGGATEPGSAGGSSTPAASATSSSDGSASSQSANSYSNTGVGQLLGGIAAGMPFSVAGRLSFDGAGNVSATSAAQGGNTMVVGTYNVHSDCGITVKLKDAFGNATANTTPAQLEGVVVGMGSEIDLGMAPAASGSGSPSGTGSSTGSGGSSGSSGSQSTTSASAVPSNLVIRLMKLLSPSGCSVSNLSGPYGLVLSGILTQAPSTTGTGSGGSITAGAATPTTQQLTLIGRLQFDGGGNVVANPTGAMSATGVSQFTGTYTVNPDCTGSMNISSADAASPPTTVSANPPMKVNFVLSAPSIVVNSGNPNVGTYALRPGIEVSTSSSTEAASGSAKAQ